MFKKEKALNLTGREMIFHLLKNTHLANAITFYLNLAETRHFRPYDLITVTRSHVRI